MRRTRWIGGLTAVAALAPASPALAHDNGAPFGQHVSSCAQAHLGKRANPPALTCEHDGHVHTFANFGEMVQHMLEHH